MRRWIRRAWCCGALLALAGCSAGDSEDAGAGGFGGGPPDGGLMCGEGEYAVGNRCVGPVPEDRLARCAFVEDLVAGCQDADGDCHVVGCTLPLPNDLLDRITDCDDQRADVWAGAPERCDGRDNDCDAFTDEGFDLGAECASACGAGILECSATDATAAACSTDAGQSAHVITDETCDGADEDCDGVVDEGCALALATPAAPEAPVWCGDRLYFTEAEALYRLNLPEMYTGDPLAVQAVEGGERPWAVTCAGDYAAWLRLGEAGCEADEAAADETEADETVGAPPSCAASVILSTPEGAALNLTGLGRHGPPRLDEAAIYWHALVDGRPFLKRRALDGEGVEDLGPDLSDPTPGPLGALALRRWTEDQSEILLRTGLGDTLLRGPLPPGGPPQFDEGWLIWPLADGALWAQPLADDLTPEGAGFQPLDGPLSAPTLAGGRLWWLTPEGLRWLNLQDGRRGLLPTGPVTDLTVGEAGLFYTTADGLRRWPLPDAQD